MVTIGMTTRKLACLILVVATINNQLLDEAQLGVQAAEFLTGPQGGRFSHRHYQPLTTQTLKTPHQLIDCERVVASEGTAHDTDNCFAIIEAALRSSYGLEMIRSMIENVAGGAAMRQTRTTQPKTNNGHQQQQQPEQQQLKARREPRSPAPAVANGHRTPSFVPDSFSLGGDAFKGQPSEALSKLLLNGLGEAGNGAGASPYGEEFSMLDNNDKPIWAGAMSDEIQSRWQPMRGKRA